MLVLSRRKGESIMIGEHIELQVLGVEGDVVKLGISAPKQVEIFRKEVFVSIKQSNIEAVQGQLDIEPLRQWMGKRENGK